MLLPEEEALPVLLIDVPPVVVGPPTPDAGLPVVEPEGPPVVIAAESSPPDGLEVPHATSESVATSPVKGKAKGRFMIDHARFEHL